MGLLTAAVAVAGGAGAIAAAPVVLTAVGFTGAGIAAGSIASSMMSAAAVANGGGVAAGSVVAGLQAAGAAGIPAAAQAVIGGIGAAASTLGWFALI
ncbi:interferon alpha inducible protein 27.2 [Danio rerio]|uniref:Interferon alpha inducible protein 27.2 n=1 Tax=Danio rerio TaxID=7955 RepID=F6NVZ1_DANRE|nr:interferon alpha inducible protein 27.2 [Danio rerio]NP_001278863.1 interferon alpha inducible protein 27.2 [Danio rerio]|eukprot:NP_001007134.2 interferon stimulated gene 12 [Danio rerio]